MMDLHDQPHLAQAILKKVVDYWIELGTSILEAADGLIDIFVINDDYGMQQGPMFNPQIWREYLKPLIQDAINAYRAYDVKIMFHSCGSIISFIPDFIEMGVNILDPVQVSAKSMDLHYLKKEFGKSLCFRGAIDTQRILPCGSFDEVREAVKSTINLLAEGGGYFLTSVHNLQPDVKPENILAMYEEGLTSGQYPIKLEK
jgi:uroporphyrinogen decarboxylase